MPISDSQVLCILLSLSLPGHSGKLLKTIWHLVISFRHYTSTLSCLCLCLSLCLFLCLSLPTLLSLSHIPLPSLISSLPSVPYALLSFLFPLSLCACYDEESCLNGKELRIASNLQPVGNWDSQSIDPKGTDSYTWVKVEADFSPAELWHNCNLKKIIWLQPSERRWPSASETWASR